MENTLWQTIIRVPYSGKLFAQKLLQVSALAGSEVEL